MSAREAGQPSDVPEPERGADESAAQSRSAGEERGAHEASAADERGARSNSAADPGSARVSSAAEERNAAPGSRLGPAERRALLDDMELALRSEFGALALYPWLARRARDEELAAVLHSLAADERQLVADLRQLMAELGAHPPHGNLRRRMASAALVALTPLFGLRVALRLSLDAEETVARWYDRQAAFLAQQREYALARRCEALALAKRRHAQTLTTFAQHGAGV